MIRFPPTPQRTRKPPTRRWWFYDDGTQPPLQFLRSHGPLNHLNINSLVKVAIVINGLEETHEYCFQHSITPHFVYSTDTSTSSSSLIFSYSLHFKWPRSILIWFPSKKQAAKHILKLRGTLYHSTTSVKYYRQIVDPGNFVFSYSIEKIGRCAFESEFFGTIGFFFFFRAPLNRTISYRRNLGVSADIKVRQQRCKSNNDRTARMNPT